MTLHTAPVTVGTEVRTRVPDEYRKPNSTASWIVANRPGQAVDCFLEGPSFDRDGDLYVTDIPFGPIFRITRGAQCSLIAEHGGWPNGLKIHRDGRIFTTDSETGSILRVTTARPGQAMFSHQDT
jgi:gluconolactonase